MDGKLQEDGEQDVKVQDRGERSFLGQLLHRLKGGNPLIRIRQVFAEERSEAHLGSRNAVEANTHQDTGDGDLVISELDSVQVLDTQRVGGDKSVETKDQEHLSSGNQSTSTLTDDAGD